MRRALRWLLDLDRSYFLALSAFVFALAASVFLLFVPAFAVMNSDGVEVTGTLIQVHGARATGLLIVPLLVTCAPLLVLPRKKGPVRRNHKVNAVATTVMLLVFIGVTIALLTVLPYLPALILSTASTASLFFGRDRKPGALDMAKRGKRGGVEPRQEPRQAQQGEKIRLSGKRRRKGAR
jgi:hypothetical protein